MSKIKSFIERSFIFSLFFIFALYSSFAEEASLPSGYGKLKLGMAVDDVKETLKSMPEFGYRGDRDVSLVPKDKEVLIETDASRAVSSFFERCWFQFSDEKLYIITLNLNPSRIDYYSIFRKLCEKYGQPDSLSPDKSLWQDDNVIMSLEKPLALKYVDASAFKKLQDSSNVDKTQTEKNKERFLESL